MNHIYQIMAECDCPRPHDCSSEGFCLAKAEGARTQSRAEHRLSVGLKVAEAYATLSTCPRRKVGAVIVDVKGRPLSVGYNGPASGRPHCIDHPCPGAKFPSGQGLEFCEAIHAEQNAILHLREPDRAHTIFVTAFPCHSCIKLLLGTSITRIAYRDSYAHAESVTWWTEAGREIIQVSSK